MLKDSVVCAITFNEGALVLWGGVASNRRCNGETAEGEPRDQTRENHVGY